MLLAKRVFPMARAVPRRGDDSIRPHVLMKNQMGLRDEGKMIMMRMKLRHILGGVMVVVALFGITGCAQIQTMSTPNPVTVQEYGCAGDLPSPYAPYCRPARP